MPPVPERIEYRNGAALVAEAVCSADGVTLAVYDAQGGQTAYLQVNPQGRLDISTGGGVIALADGLLELTGDLQISGSMVRAINLPGEDPADQGRLWNAYDLSAFRVEDPTTADAEVVANALNALVDALAGTVKVSAG